MKLLTPILVISQKLEFTITMHEGEMEREMYITNEEREKCRKVADAYAEFYELEDIFVADAGKYGFIKLLYYTDINGFENMQTYTESKIFFDDLWDDWIEYQFYEIASGTLAAELSYDGLFNSLPKIIQKEIKDKRFYFAEMTGLNNEEKD
jgi:hypothetical protein